VFTSRQPLCELYERFINFSLSAVGEQNLQDAYKKRFEPLNDTVIKQMKNSRVTALCMLNTRALAGIQVMH
jgi:hypothetical protein